MRERYFAHGECTGCKSKEALAGRLVAEHVGIQERSYAIDLPAHGCWTLEFDQASEDEATIEGTTLGFPDLERDAWTVSVALAAAGVRHWIKLTDDVQQPLGYLHYLWPEQA